MSTAVAHSLRCKLLNFNIYCNLVVICIKFILYTFLIFRIASTSAKSTHNTDIYKEVMRKLTEAL